MYNILLQIIFLTAASLAFSQDYKEHPGLFCRITKISKQKNILILDIGREENLKKGDFALLSYHGEEVAKIAIKQLSATRSMWEVFDKISIEKLSTNAVFHFKFISAKEFTPDKGDLPESEIKADYKGPLPFPYISKSKVTLAFESGSRYRSDFDYPAPGDEGNHGQRFEFSSGWIYRSDFDHRFYFGPSVRLLTQSNKFSLSNKNEINEKRRRIGLGPLFQVIFWGNQKYSVSGLVNLLVYYDQIEINNTIRNSITEKASFSGISLGHAIGLSWQVQRIIGLNHFSLGLTAITDYPHTLKSSQELNPFIFPEHRIENKTHTNFLLRLGLHIPLRI
jgi:hypothetical protein